MKSNVIRNFAAAAAVAFGLAVFSYADAVTVGTSAPQFSLKDTKGKTHKLSDTKGKFVVLEWVNLGCPFVKKHYESNNMQKLQKEWTAKGVIWLSICSSAKGHQGSMTPKEWEAAIKDKHIASTAVLLDGKGKVGKMYGAKTTPHMFIINPDGNLVYLGAIDSKASTDASDIEKSTNYVSQALTEAMEGKAISVASTESYGCSVKY